MNVLKGTTAVVVGLIVFVALCVGGWFLYWHLNKSAVGHQYDINTGTQQYQAGLISQERDRVEAYNIAVDPAQKAQLKSTFCTVFVDLKQPPADLVQANATICY